MPPPNRWELVIAGARDGNRHVLPLDDLRDHVESAACWCGPRLERLANRAILVTHHALDGRELIEQHGLQ
jgi:hypothetical protein